MNESIKLLGETASKHEKLIVGLMSGTSLDGLDAALCKIKGCGPETELKLLEFTTLAYSSEVSQKLESVVSVDNVSTQKLTLLNSYLGDYFGKAVLQVLNEWQLNPSGVDCIASHGQTVYHAPVSKHGHKKWPNATLQIGDGDQTACKAGILTVSDFRQKHTAAGGEGAPMVSLVDELLYRDDQENRLFLNIGGIANFTYLPAGKNKKVISTDTGPGNTLINKVMGAHFNEPYDKDGEMAQMGTVQPNLLKSLLSDSFFNLSIPTSTGPEMFNTDWVKKHQRKTKTEDIADKDLIATLTWLSAQTIAEAIEKVCIPEETNVYISGGGMYNKTLTAWIEKLIEQKIYSFEKVGFKPDAKEAACFAVLANETLSGEGFLVNNQKVNFGKISLPV